MKTTIFSLRIISLFIIIPFLSAIFLTGCSKDSFNDNDAITSSAGSGNGMGESFTTQGEATGSQQNPTVATTGNAKMVGIYNSTTNKWEYSISWSSLSGAAMRIELHGPADMGVNGETIFNIDMEAGQQNGAISKTVTLTEQQEAYLLNRQMYYTITTPSYSNGEVRGQIQAYTR